MKILSCFSAIILLCGLSGTAMADPVDFQFRIQDPDPPVLPVTPVYANTPFSVTFGSCLLGRSRKRLLLRGKPE